MISGRLPATNASRRRRPPSPGPGLPCRAKRRVAAEHLSEIMLAINAFRTLGIALGIRELRRPTGCARGVKAGRGTKQVGVVEAANRNHDHSRRGWPTPQNLRPALRTELPRDRIAAVRAGLELRELSGDRKGVVWEHDDSGEGSTARVLAITAIADSAHQGRGRTRVAHATAEAATADREGRHPLALTPRPGFDDAPALFPTHPAGSSRGVRSRLLPSAPTGAMVASHSGSNTRVQHANSRQTPSGSKK